MSKQKNIILIGFMGCGKTTCAKWIANNKPFDFIDTDQCIINKEGRSINEIFDCDGELYFRKLETMVLKEFLAGESMRQKVFSVGGGLPITQENRPLLKQLGYVVYLRTSVDELVKRLNKDTQRPLLAGGNVRDKIVRLMEQRKDIYL